MTSPLNVRIRRSVAAALALLLAPLAARADFTFVHITDTHVSTAAAEGNNAAHDAAPFDEIGGSQPRPAFVAHTGDVCETATPTEYENWQNVLRELSVRIHVAPGNHDVRWNPL